MNKDSFVWYRIIIKVNTVFCTLLRLATGKRLIIDVTGTILTPGNGGKNCKGNGTHLNWRGKRIECCCGECDYLMCCTEHKERES